MIVNNLLPNLLLLAALVMTCDTRMRLKDAKGITAYVLIAAAFAIKLLTQTWGHNIWLVLFLVVLIQSNSLVQNMVTGFREELGFWPFLGVILIGLIGFRMLYAMVRLLLPLAIVILLIFLVSTKKSSQR
ncbi:hypothetical protein FD29_GL001466 [Companilactobacillus mindensis DSM 14500]|uniref:Uncharacterized protein n=1 Tax=Companilactobacillus mindensis DSM 14500 TaxID=1423770 RepID=A0A0R1QDJ6_9LACO|nr:hypothetical protein [Companilactobacillus mindensis]KRL42816.1 hypothetical protein FD29_GL001466 [Companilactobacillus mindensis DSM 14500]GEO78810.1 hypothetical protein LMI01_11410 [Companilactobacillus mindensis]